MKDNVLSLSLIMRLFKKEKKKIAIIVLSFTTIMLIVSYFLPHKYESYATLMPPSNKEGSGLSSFLQSFAGGAGGIMLGGVGKSNQSNVFADMLKSRTISRYINKKLKLTDYTPYRDFENEIAMFDFISENIDVVVEKTSGIISVYSVSETGYFPGENDKLLSSKLSAEIANTAIEALDYFLRHKSISTAKQTKEYIENEINNYKIQLNTIESQMEKFQSEHKVLAIEEQTTAIVQQAIEVGKELAEAKVELAVLSNELNPNSAQIKAIKDKVLTLQNQYESIQTGGLVESDAFAFPLKQVPTLLKEYARLLRERKVLEQVTLYLETQRHQEAIQEKKDIPIVEVLDKAEVPYKRIAPSRKIIAILSFSLSLLVALGYVLMRAYKQGSIIIEREG